MQAFKTKNKCVIYPSYFVVAWQKHKDIYITPGQVKVNANADSFRVLKHL
jgi:hypothetical protein